MKATNLSKQKREKMLNTLNEIKKKVTDDSVLQNITLIENELNNKKYGLIWEEHQERVDLELQTQIPVFEDVEDKKIYNDKNNNYNFLLEGDNLHSLYLLEKTHKGKIDVIYIDPPYNTGAKTWKYNNDYVDKNDLFAHSKWLSMMNKRLLTAKKLLSDNGALICSIDENELCSLGLLLDEVFGQTYEIHPITIVHNPRGIQGKNFSYTHEYVYFVFKNGKKVIGNRKIEPDKIDWRNLRDNGGESLRENAKNCFYPIIINPKTYKIVGFGEVSEPNFHPSQNEKKDGLIYVYPIDKNGTERKWRYARQSVEKINDNLITRKINKNFEIYLGKNFGTYRTVWIDPKYDANEYGKKMLNNIVIDNNFDYPKSLYNVYDCLYAIISNKKNAIVLDFFAGSGTTAQAVLELNKEDGGNRQFILCTNNENNICEDITYQRIKTVITGKRKDESIYSEGIPANLKYFKTSYVPRINTEEENLHTNLLVNIKNLIELENGIDIDDKKIRVYLNEKELDSFSSNEKGLKECEIIYISSDVLLSQVQEQKFRDNNIKVFIIPEYYFKDEIMEVL